MPPLFFALPQPARPGPNLSQHMRPGSDHEHETSNHHFEPGRPTSGNSPGLPVLRGLSGQGRIGGGARSRRQGAPETGPPDSCDHEFHRQIRIAPTGKERCLKLIYPGTRDNHEETVSILAQMGSMLIGLSEGDEMSWPLPSEETFRLVIKEVVEQPERSGNFDL